MEPNSTSGPGLDPQRLISVSMMKIQKSRNQRGGVRLHRNLLVSYVLRDARHIYFRDLCRKQQDQEVLTVCTGIQYLDPLHGDGRGQLGTDQREPDTRTLGSGFVQVPDLLSCCMDQQNQHRFCTRTTVLDLDTHVVTTVENGSVHGQDCCCLTGQEAPNPARKRKLDPDELADFTGSRKRSRPEEESSAVGSEVSDPAHISALISIFGSGFSGLLSRNQDLDLVYSKQVSAGLGAWARIIVAF